MISSVVHLFANYSLEDFVSFYGAVQKCEARLSQEYMEGYQLEIRE